MLALESRELPEWRGAMNILITGQSFNGGGNLAACLKIKGRQDWHRPEPDLIYLIRRRLRTGGRGVLRRADLYSIWGVQPPRRGGFMSKFRRGSWYCSIR
jgi:hypothetical protein